MTEEQLARLLHAARSAPTAHNLQNFRLIVVDDRQILANPREDKTVSVDTAFGATVVKLNPTVPVEIIGHSMFGQVRMPDRTMAAMGSIAYKTPAEHEPKLHLRINTVFGSCQVVGASATAPADHHEAR